MENQFPFSLSAFRYGGPGTQEVSSKWSLEWNHFLSSNRDFIIVNMDVRGSGFSGDSFKHAVYKELGTVQAQDVIYVTK